ncbi:MAG: M28 family metallopeptidase [Chitinophagaceae bacterium]
MRKLTVLCLLSLFSLSSKAQFKHRIRQHLDTLCAPGLYGRGYVDGGVNRAARFLYEKMEKAKLKPLPLANDSNAYYQAYSFSVNRQPKPIALRVNFPYEQQTLKPGYDFLIDAASPAIQANALQIISIDASDSNQRKSLFNHPGFPANTALVLRFMPRSEKKNVMKALQANPNPPRLLLFTVTNKLTHTVSTKVDALPSLWIFDSLLDNAKSVAIDYQNEFHQNYVCRNVAGYIPGKNPDSFIVFSAHYDHLGMMGPNARFAGASDNASGTAFVLELMRYYKKHKPEYNTAFIFFSGEEAGLLGSNYFVQHPLLPLNRIKHLINIDIMGNAENGITVVNANTWPTRFQQLQQTNKKLKVNPRGASHNSDHAPFSDLGVPAFFIYSNGGPGFYHDVFDLPETCKLKGVKPIFRSITRWVSIL